MPIDPVARAITTYRLILDKPISIVFTKPKAVSGSGVVTPALVLAAQICRINSDNRASVVGGSAGIAPKRAVMIYGVTAHPTAPANTIEEGYTFVYQGDTYRVEDPIPGTPGAIQAQATAIG